MGSPTIFSGKRTKTLTSKGLLLRDGSIVDYDGLVNYIKNGHAELNANGWSTYADAASATPTDGIGGSPTVTFVRSTSSPLSGDASFLMTKDAANRQGEGASYDLTIDAADNVTMQNLVIDFSYETGGTFVVGSSSDVRVYIYDITNASLITPLQTILNATAGRFQSTFTTETTSTSYRLIFHVATTSASAWTLKVDRVSIRPLVNLVGAVTAPSYVLLTAGNGFGSTNTNVRRYTNSTVIGSAFTYADSATDGASITINEDGTYSMNRLDRNTGAASNFGITLNDVASSGINSVASGSRLSYTMTASNLSSNAPNTGFPLSIGDVIRACDDSGAKTNDTNELTSRFLITKLKDPALPSSFIVATGGSITTDGNYKVHTFTSSGTFEILSGTGTVESLVVAGGGGGGGGYYGGGGGAGGLIHTTPGASYGVGTYTVTVGSGGSGGAATPSSGSNGGASAFDSINASGGGGGGLGNNPSSANGSNGGSGGGGGGGNSPGSDTTGGTGTALQGNDGGSGGIPSAGLGGGGGGAGAVGGSYSGSNAGSGGNGSSINITGTPTTYGGGGGGGASGGGTSGSGGSGGGGAGGTSSNGVAGTANTGGGGGGAGDPSTLRAGGDGGSGIVIVRYRFQ